MNKNSVFSVCVTCGIVLLTGCSATYKNRGQANNVAYSVPESVARDGMEVRVRPLRPYWTEDDFSVANFRRRGRAESRANAVTFRPETYVVKKGDTVYSIARRFGISAREIMDLNNLDGFLQLRVGQEIKLPREDGEAEFDHIAKKYGFSTRDTIKYTVERGDSLLKIAKMHSMKVDELKELNGLTSDFIRAGQRLDVYRPNGFVSDMDSVGSKRDIVKYTVEHGDSLSKIAKKHSMKIAELMELNGLSGDLIRVGQRLEVYKPDGRIAKSGTAKVKADLGKRKVVKYVVKQGDSLSKIAKMHSMKIAELRKLNTLSSDTIVIGQQLDVYSPNDPTSFKVKETSPKKYTLDADGLYTIQEGDSLDKIARGFGVSSKVLGEVNGVDDPLKLQVGKKLVIPSNDAVSKPVIGSAVSAQDRAKPRVPSEDRMKVPGTGNNLSREGSDDDFFETFDNIEVFEVD
ncbi:MAG: LysM peptidoglycan-binding domain-containing protein [Puniceicoccales bacterium]|jgi:LysM repeat protein|nr:LysM peptidoglycan-binding domain-containing protein [Puniceicoccales bacterium]